MYTSYFVKTYIYLEGLLVLMIFMFSWFKEFLIWAWLPIFMTMFVTLCFCTHIIYVFSWFCFHEYVCALWTLSVLVTMWIHVSWKIIFDDFHVLRNIELDCPFSWLCFSYYAYALTLFMFSHDFVFMSMIYTS